MLAWIKRGGTRPTLLFECHLDTVGLDPMPDALNPRVTDGRLFGRGSADPKGSMAAMLHLLQIAASDPLFPVDLCLAGSVDEEIEMSGSRALAQKNLAVDAVIVGEPTQLRIVTAQKGVVRWRVRTHGVAAHSATPELGQNAIRDMARVVEGLAAGIEPQLTTQSHPVLGNATWNIGTIQGGSAVNVVPDVCEIEIDRRLIPGETANEVIQHVDTVLRELRDSYPDLRVEHDQPFVDLPAIHTADSQPIVQAAQRSVAAIGLPSIPEAVAYATDAAMLSGIGGIPAVVLGPGNIAQAHTSNEWIALDQLEQAVSIYQDICRQYAEIVS